ncbi:MULTISPECIES: hypothetical protein [unclassified Pseudomonas]|uniref:hypothetical protein n=1 Tax=unclassified Pseudomonas TaxID=196821 RepID=UPI00131B4CD4|nr:MULTISPECIES: hypothetical protein [unclassified Pseudomonas]
MADSSYDASTAKLLDVVSEAQSNALSAAGRIPSGTYASLLEKSFSFSDSAITLEAPPSFSELFGVAQADSDITALNSQVQAWLDSQFPNISSTLAGIPEDWIAGIVAGTRPFGIDSTVFDLVWQQARDRAARTVDSDRRTLEANCSKRGFSLPDGTLVAALLESEQRGQAAVLDVNREQTIKDADIKLELLKFAVQQAAQLRLGILSASADMFRAYYALYNTDIERDRARASAYGSYMGAMSSYWNVELGIEQVRLRAAEARADNSVAINRNRVANAGLQSGNSSLGAAVQGFAQIASSAASAAGTLTAQIQSL